MLKFYLVSVVICMIIIQCILSMFKDGLRQKIGIKETSKIGLFNRLKTLFVVSAVPVVRLFVVITLVYIATCKQEDFDKLINKNKEI